MKKHWLPLAILLLTRPTLVSAQGANLVPNWNFSDKTNPLNTFRFDFPYQESYVKNASYIKVSPTVRDGDSPAVEMDLPKGVAENEGCKFESALIKIEPGASYHASIDVMTYELAARCYVEVYAVDPTNIPLTTNLDRIPASGGVPALVKCYRAVFDDPVAKNKSWVTVKRDFTVPSQVTVLGKPASPAYATVKAFGCLYEVGSHGTTYFSKFVLTKTKNAPASTAHGTIP